MSVASLAPYAVSRQLTSLAQLQCELVRRGYPSAINGLPAGFADAAFPLVQAYQRLPRASDAARITVVANEILDHLLRFS